MITYTFTDDIHGFTGQYDSSYEEWESIINKFKKNFKYGSSIFDCGMDKHIYFLALDGKDIVGILKFKTGDNDSCYHPGFCNWICFIDVQLKYRNQGISKKMKEMLFKYCSENDMNILSSGFTVLGHMYSMKGYIRLAEKYNVEYNYTDGIKHPDFNNFEGMDEDEYRAYYKKHSVDWLNENNIVINEKK